LIHLRQGNAQAMGGGGHAGDLATARAVATFTASVLAR